VLAVLITVGSINGAVRLAAWAKPVESVARRRARARRLQEFMAGRGGEVVE
jgi:hypothetical protein